MRYQKEKAYANWIKCKTNENLEAKFKDVKKKYNKLLRAKQIEYFDNKKACDFKNSKKFYEFYKSYI
jgi:hypothetical protein